MSRFRRIFMNGKPAHDRFGPNQNATTYLNSLRPGEIFPGGIQRRATDADEYANFLDIIGEPDIDFRQTQFAQHFNAPSIVDHPVLRDSLPRFTVNNGRVSWNLLPVPGPKLLFIVYRRHVLVHMTNRTSMALELRVTESRGAGDRTQRVLIRHG